MYPEHIAHIVQTYKDNCNNVFCSINTTGFNTELNGLAHINLSRNDYVGADPVDYPGCTVQTVIENPTLAFIKEYMKKLMFTHSALEISLSMQPLIMQESTPV